jgi:predicted ArsR family transcriptional regulator
VKQIDIDFTRARHSDPDTSHASAARVGEFDGAHFAAIRAALKTRGPMTFHEIAGVTGLDGQQVNKRLPELEAAQLVRTTGEKRPSPSGRACRVWESCEKGTP